MIDTMPADPAPSDIEAWDLAALLRDRALEMGRDPVVLCAAALLKSDPEGMRQWVRSQRSEALPTA